MVAILSLSLSVPGPIIPFGRSAPCAEKLIGLNRFLATPRLPSEAQARFYGIFQKVRGRVDDHEKRILYLAALISEAKRERASDFFEAWLSERRKVIGGRELFGWEVIEVLGVESLEKCVRDYLCVRISLHEVIESEGLERPGILMILKSSARPWNHFQNYVIFFIEPVPVCLSLRRSSERLGIRVAFDSNLLPWKRPHLTNKYGERNSVENIFELTKLLQVEVGGEANLRVRILPEVIFEGGGLHEVLTSSRRGPFSYELAFSTHPDSSTVDDLQALISIFQRARYKYDLKHHPRFGEPTPNIELSDDRFLAEAAVDGVSLAFTRDARMFDAVAAAGLGTDRSWLKLSNGYRYAALRIQLSVNGRDYSFHLVDVLRGKRHSS